MEYRGNRCLLSGENTTDTPYYCFHSIRIGWEKPSASELIGKSGHVKISVKLTNHEKTTQEINGKQRIFYTPFITVVSANFPTENFKNIIAAQGTVQTDSANQLACFITIPGMAQTFDGLLTGQLDQINEYLKDEVIVEADTDCFQMPSFMIASATSMEQLKKKTIFLTCRNLLTN